ncbi:MAG: HAD-IG family 5'-nucleotidase [Myxococcales bacterium]|nr:HAD-IG family 5'-nucleotidase [Myxococcales bacterium]
MVGFDMDYTLAIYNQAEIDKVSIEVTAKKLVESGYPQKLLAMGFRTDFPVRGLLIDKELGNILKMDSHRYVKKAYHGFTELPLQERRTLYHRARLRVNTPRYHWVDTLYALSEVSVFAAVVEELERDGTALNYEQLFTDIRRCIDLAHRDGSILDIVTADLPRFLHKDPLLAPTLHKLRSSGKQLFLLTNSGPDYTDRLMTYLLSEAISEYPSWRSYFDIIITAACKPDFFNGNSPFLEADVNGASREAESLARGKVYTGGNITVFERLAGCDPDGVLYVGDHIYGDVLRTKKESAWRTAMIIQELSDEMTALEQCDDDLRRLDALETLRDTLYDELRERQEQLRDVQTQLASLQSTSDHSLGLDTLRLTLRRRTEVIRHRFRWIDEEYAALEEQVDCAFHPFWGSLLNSGSELSSFGSQVEKFACLYTNRVSSFWHYSPMHYFRSPRDRMPHELKA